MQKTIQTKRLQYDITAVLRNCAEANKGTPYLQVPGEIADPSTG